MGIVEAFFGLEDKKTDKNEELEKRMENMGLEEWEKEEVRKGNFDELGFEEEDLEEEDYYFEDGE